MSWPIWTPAALRSELRPWAGCCWRLVEAQHRVSTMALADTLEDQALLEGILEETKPPIPPDCRSLHYLLYTPFRYDAPYPTGSRFRRAGRTPGVFYAAETPETAVAEVGYYRLRFYAESPATPMPRSPAVFTAFAAALDSAWTLDLTAPPLNRDQEAWMSRTDYTACQALAEAARAVGVECLRARSVRDPGAGGTVAVLACRAFAQPHPVDTQTWHLRFTPHGLQAVREYPSQSLEFSCETLGA